MSPRPPGTINSKINRFSRAGFPVTGWVWAYQTGLFQPLMASFLTPTSRFRDISKFKVSKVCTTVGRFLHFRPKIFRTSEKPKYLKLLVWSFYVPNNLKTPPYSKNNFDLLFFKLKKKLDRAVKNRGIYLFNIHF